MKAALWMLLLAMDMGTATAQTSLPPPVIQLSAKDFTGPRQAPPVTTPDGFVAALTEPANKCATVGYKARMEANIDYRSQATGNARAALAACLDAARQSGTDAYKAFAAGPASVPVKASGKELYVAWLAYLPGWVNGQHGAQSEADYRQAFARFQADTLTP